MTTCARPVGIVRLPADGSSRLRPLSAHSLHGRQPACIRIHTGPRAESNSTAPPARQQDERTVFVAGATGRVGRRVVRELLCEGFSVRANVRSLSKGADQLTAAVASGALTPAQAKLVTLVECDLEKRTDSLAAAIGPAAVVVCAIGAAETDLADVAGPYRVDGQAAIGLVRAAVAAKVTHFVLVSSLGAGKLGWPASVLNLFYGVLLWKRQAEVALQSSGLNYTIVRPGGMERPKDDYKETHKAVLSAADTVFGGQISRLQVAELIAAAVMRPGVACNKTVEAVAEPGAPSLPYDDLLAAIPKDSPHSFSADALAFPLAVSRRAAEFSAEMSAEFSADVAAVGAAAGRVAAAVAAPLSRLEGEAEARFDAWALGELLEKDKHKDPVSKFVIRRLTYPGLLRAQKFVKTHPSYALAVASVFAEARLSRSGALTGSDVARLSHLIFPQLLACLRDEGISVDMPTDEEVASVLRAADANADGLLQASEFDGFVEALLAHLQWKWGLQLLVRYLTAMVAGVAFAGSIKHLVRYELHGIGIGIGESLAGRIPPSVVLGPILGLGLAFALTAGGGAVAVSLGWVRPWLPRLRGPAIRAADFLRWFFLGGAPPPPADGTAELAAAGRRQ